MNGMTISDLAKAGNVGVETIRFYQRRGLLEKPDKPANGGAIRRYNAEHVRRLRFIRSAQTAGFTLAEITQLIMLDSTSDRPRARSMARERIAAIDTQISELQQARDALSLLAQECASGGKGPCPILKSFESMT